MATTIGLPSLTITFQAAAQQAANRSKKGYVGVFVRDAKAQGVHQLSSAALIPTELGQDNQDYIKRAFTGSDRGGPSKVVAVVIATGTEDTTGVGLHKRGYRAVGVAAPLRETLAAAMVLLSRYRGRDPFCDPFCGSGTIAIEAALIAKNRAPGLNRAFSAQKWRWLDSGLWLQAADEAMDGEYDGAYDIWGGDIDPKAVAIARANAEKADVEDAVRFEVADAAAFRRDAPYGRVVTNPPYGERILEKREAEELYRAFGRAVCTLPEGWRVSVLSSHTEFERTFGRTADKKRKLYNGMLKCDLFQYGR